MYAKKTQLYPFSMKNVPAIKAYADKFLDDEEVSPEEIKVLALLHDIDFYFDGKVTWLSGSRIAYAKKILASA